VKQPKNMVKCHECGESYRKASGGHCTVCHRTFSSVSAGDQHRRGPFDARYCADMENDIRVRRDGTTRKVEWRLNMYGEWTDAPPWDGLRRNTGA
jgi:hypothetical protein